MSTDVKFKLNETQMNQDLLLQEIQNLSSFSGEPAEFLKRLLALKCRFGQAQGAALLRQSEIGAKIQVLSLAPKALAEKAVMPEWLKEAIRIFPEKADGERVRSLPYKGKTHGETQNAYLVFMPVKAGEQAIGTEVYLIEANNIPDFQTKLERLEILLPYFDYYEGRVELKDYQGRTERLHKACEVLIKLNQADSFLEAAMLLCNEMAARYSCSRVGLGVLKGRYIRLKALSNTEKFKRKMKILQGMEKVMEECLDQDLEVVYPQKGKGDYVARAANTYSDEYGPLSVLSMPLREDGKVKAVLTFEREKERPFSPEEVELFRLILDLFSPRLLHLYEFERWFGARALASARKTLSFIVGAKYTWYKIIFLALVGAGFWLSQATGIYQVEATFSFDSKQRQMVVIPFDGEIDEVKVRNGDEVKAGQTLLTLDTTEQVLKLDNLQAKRLEALKRVSVAMNEGKTAEAQIAQAEADQTATELKLINYNINRAKITAPIDGLVVTQDLHKRLYSVVKFGENILEVTEMNRFKATLYVPEEQIADVEIGFKGELAAAGYPDKKVPFKVKEINRVAEVANQRNVFRVTAELTLSDADQEAFYDWASLGMEGVARIDVDERLLAWIWTREAINYLRMKFWF